MIFATPLYMSIPLGAVFGDFLGNTCYSTLASFVRIEPRYLQASTVGIGVDPMIVVLLWSNEMLTNISLPTLNANVKTYIHLLTILLYKTENLK